MATKKTAFSLPRVARLERDRDITAQIDALFSDGKIAAEQKRTADEFLRVSPWPRPFRRRSSIRSDVKRP